MTLYSTDNIILNGEMCSEIRNKARMAALITLIQLVLEFLANAIRQKKKKGTNDFLKQKLFEGVLHQGPPALGIYFLADILVLFARKIAALNGLCSSPLTSFLICIVLQISSLFIMHFLLKFVSFHLTRYSNI